MKANFQMRGVRGSRQAEKLRESSVHVLQIAISPAADYFAALVQPATAKSSKESVYDTLLRTASVEAPKNFVIVFKKSAGELEPLMNWHSEGNQGVPLLCLLWVDSGFTSLALYSQARLSVSAGSPTTRCVCLRRALAVARRPPGQGLAAPLAP